MHPDGLEWSILKTYGQEELSRERSGIAEKLARFQERLSFLPDYSFKTDLSASEKGELGNVV
jgi:cobalt/nickel transport system permease protein